MFFVSLQRFLYFKRQSRRPPKINFSPHICSIVHVKLGVAGDFSPCIQITNGAVSDAVTIAAGPSERGGRSIRLYAAVVILLTRHIGPPKNKREIFDIAALSRIVAVI